jgi:hypothetical protein
MNARSPEGSMSEWEPTVWSPVWGSVVVAGTSLLVQIRAEPQSLCAPFGGVLTIVNAEESQLSTEHLLDPFGKVFSKAMIQVMGNDGRSVTVWVYVKKEARNSEVVRLLPEMSTGSVVMASQKIGEILMDSLVFVYLPTGNAPHPLWTCKGASVVGGLTPLTT